MPTRPVRSCSANETLEEATFRSVPMVTLARALEAFQFLLAALCMLLAIQFRGELGFPPKFYGDAAWKGRAKVREIATAAVVVVVILVIQGLLTLIEQAMQHPIFADAYEDLAKEWYLYGAFAVTGWIAGRFGGRYGTACALGTILFPVVFLLAIVPVGIVALGAVPQKGAIFMHAILLQWYFTVLQAPPALALTLAASMAGRLRSTN